MYFVPAAYSLDHPAILENLPLLGLNLFPLTWRLLGSVELLKIALLVVRRGPFAVGLWLVEL